MESLRYSVNALPKMVSLIVYRSQRRKMADIFASCVFWVINNLVENLVPKKLELQNKLLFNLFSKQNENCDSPSKQRAE